MEKGRRKFHVKTVTEMAPSINLSFDEDMHSSSSSSSSSSSKEGVGMEDFGYGPSSSSSKEEYHNFEFTYNMHSNIFTKEEEREEEERRESTAPDIAGGNYIRIREYETLKLNKDEAAGILTNRIIETCSSSLDRSPKSGKYILTKCKLNEKMLSKIDVISSHPYIHFLDLSRNNLEDLSALSHLKFLEYLDVSHNIIHKLLNFTPSIKLSWVNFSYNLVDEIPDLGLFWSIVYLDLSNNMIKSIYGLRGLKYLNFLDISGNELAKVENLDDLPLQTLYLDYNDIEDFQSDDRHGLHTNLYLMNISISHNKLTSLALFENLRSLEFLNVSYNAITSLQEILNLDLIYLTSVDMRENPVTNNDKYRDVCFSSIINLQVLDGKLLTAEEKGLVLLKYSNDKEVDASIKRNLLEILSTFNKPEINSSVMPYYQRSAAILVLVGPMSSRKKFIMHIFKQTHPENKFVKLGVSYTTRPKSSHETEGKEYYFVTESEFFKLLLSGKLLCHSKKYGIYFGIGFDEIKNISEDIGVLIFLTDLSSALQIRSRFENCKLILCTSKDEKKYRDWLTQKYYCAIWNTRLANCYKLAYYDVFATSKNIGVIDDDTTAIINYMKATKTESEGEADAQYMYNSELAYEDHNISNDYCSYDNRASQTPDSASASLARKTSRNVSFGTDIVANVINFEKSEQKLSAIRKGTWKNISTPDMPRSLVSGSLHKFNYSTADLNASDDDDYEYKSISKVALRPRDKDDYLLSVLMSMPALNEASTSNQSDGTIESNISFTEKQRCVSQFIHSKSESYQFFFCHPSIAVEADVPADLNFEYFVTDQLEKRRKYLKAYSENPGLFFCLIFTDEEDEAIRMLEDVLRSCVKMQEKYYHSEVTKSATVCKNLREYKLNLMFDLMK